MRIAFVTIESPETICGKNTSLSRIKHGLEETGADVLWLSSAHQTEQNLEGAVREFRADLIHAFHAYKAGGTASRLSHKTGLPLVITITGTDLNQCVYDHSRSGETLANLEAADHLICPNTDTVDRLVAEFGVNSPASVVSKGVFFPNHSLLFNRKEKGIGENEVVFLFPSGIRAIKNVHFPIRPLARLHADGFPVRLVFLGHVIEEDYYQKFRRSLEGHPWAEFPGEADRDNMYSWYHLADIVLNASLAEGGSNVVLEAMATPRCVLASDIPGNRAYVHFRPGALPDSDGILYRVNGSASIPGPENHDEADFESKARQLVADPALRDRISRNAAATIEREHSVEQEARGYLEAYEHVLNSAR